MRLEKVEDSILVWLFEPTTPSAYADDLPHYAVHEKWWKNPVSTWPTLSDSSQTTWRILPRISLLGANVLKFDL